MAQELKLEKLNFYWRMKESFDDCNPDIPDFLPFSLKLDSRFNLLVQKYNQKTDHFLNEVYKLDENVGYLQDGHELADLYGSDFFDYLDSHLPQTNDGVSVLEVGCGGCYVLNHLKKQGYLVAGCDPSPVAKAAAEKLGIPIHPIFYNADEIKEKYHVIIHYDVLEHIYEPHDFLRQHAKNLEDNGRLIFAVPDCSSAIANGDISMFIHEHVNYFDVESLRHVVEAAGFTVEDISKGKSVGTLYCCARKNSVLPAEEKHFGDEKVSDFISKFNRNLSKIKASLKENSAIYIPLRALPYLCEIDTSHNLIFVDDNKAIHGQYFDGFDIPVCSFEDMLASSPNVVLVFSYVFGTLIKEKIRKSDDTINVLSLEDIFESE